MSRTRVSGICGRGHGYYQGEACPKCEAVPRSFIGIIGDEPTTAYLPREYGFPKDPTNPMKVIVPSKRAYREAEKATFDRTKGAVADSER